MPRPVATSRVGWITAVALAALAFTASASAKEATHFLLLDGPKQGEGIFADDSGEVSPGQGQITPQKDGCNYRFDGTLGGGDASGCAVPQRLLTAIYYQLGYAIANENAAHPVQGNATNTGLFVARRDLERALDQLLSWRVAIETETSGAAHDQLVTLHDQIKAADEAAIQKLKDAKQANGAARQTLIDEANGEMQDALNAKRDAWTLVRENVPIDGTIPTDPGSLPAPVDLTGGTVLAMLGPNNFLGAHNFGTPSSHGFVYDGGTVTDLPGGPPSVVYGYGPNGTVMGQQNGYPGLFDLRCGEDAYDACQIGNRPGAVLAANGYGGVGHRLKNGKEVATSFEENFKGASPGIKPVTINTPGSDDASFFTVNDQNVMYGDYFYDATHFRAFQFDPETDEILKQFFPSGGSSQPRASNDFLAAGAVVNADSTVEGVYFWDTKHYLPYDSFGQNTIINGINDAGVAVGHIGTSPNTNAALFANGQVYDLNTLIPGGSGWDLNRANAIDEDGNIGGTGTFGGQDRAFLIRGGNTVDNDLQLVKEVKGGTGTPPKFKKGQTIHFVVTLTNHGPREAKDVKVVDHIPKHCKFDHMQLDPPKLRTSSFLFHPDKGEDGGDVTVALGKPLPVGGVAKIHIFCKATKVDPQETFTNKSEVSTHPGQKEPATDPHPNTPNADYIIGP